MVGLAGEGQNFDGNGMYVRFQTGGGPNQVSVGRVEPRQPAAVRVAADPAARQPAHLSRPRARPTSPSEPCYRQARPTSTGRRPALSPPIAGRPTARTSHDRADGARERRREPRSASTSRLRRDHRPDRRGLRRGRGASSPTSGSRSPAGSRSSARTSSGQGRALERPGGHAGPGADGQRRRRRGGRDLARAAGGRQGDRDAEAAQGRGPGLQGRDRAAAARRRASRTWSPSSTPGTPDGRRSCRDGDTDPDRPDAARRQPRRDPGGLDGDTRAYLVAAAHGRRARACAATPSRSPTRSAASSRSRATPAPWPRSSRAGRSTSGASSTTSRCWSRSSAARTTSSPSSCRTRTRSSRVFAAQDASLRATLARAAVDADARRAARWPRRAGSRDELGPALEDLRPAARALGPTLQRGAPVPARDDAGHPGRDPARSCAPRAERHAAAPAAGRPVRGRARPAHAPSRSSTRSSTRWPTTRRARATRATCSGPRGSTTSGPTLFASQDAHGPLRRGLVLISCTSLALLDNVIRAEPAARRAHAAPATRRRARRSARAGRARDDPGGRLMQKSAPSFGRIAAMVVFALSCFAPGAVPVARVRRPDPAQAEGLPLQRLASPRPRSSPRRPTCASPACPSARSRRSSPTARPGARW